MWASFHVTIAHLYAFFGSLCLFLTGNVHCSKHEMFKDDWLKTPPLSAFLATWLSSLELPVCACTFKSTICWCCILNRWVAKPPGLCFKPTKMLRGECFTACRVSCISETVNLFNKCFQIHPCCSMYQNFIPLESWVIFHYVDGPHCVCPFTCWWTLASTFGWRWLMLLWTWVCKYLVGSTVLFFFLSLLFFPLHHPFLDYGNKRGIDNGT